MMTNDELRALAEAARDGSGRHNQFDKYLAAFHPERVIALLNEVREGVSTAEWERLLMEVQHLTLLTQEAQELADHYRAENAELRAALLRALTNGGQEDEREIRLHGAR